MLCCCLTIAWCLLRFSQGNLLRCCNNLSFINFINLALNIILVVSTDEVKTRSAYNHLKHCQAVHSDPAQN